MDLTSAEVVADSIFDGARLATFHLTFPRFILAEFNTHRAFSRNSESSRAVPTAQRVKQVRENLFMPTRLPKNRKGMSEFGEYLPPGDADMIWGEAAKYAANMAERMAAAGVHKAIASRLLEPFLWHTVIMSTTMPGLENFFAQRDHPDAQPEIQVLARKMREALTKSVPAETQWHIPFYAASPGSMRLLSPNAAEEMAIRSISKCARISYGRELEERTFEEDKALVVRLARDKHHSPFEHVSVAHDYIQCPSNWCERETNHSNFSAPWGQVRHHIEAYLPSIYAELTTT